VFGSDVSPSVVVDPSVSPSISLYKLKPVTKTATMNDDALVVTGQGNRDGGASGVTAVLIDRGASDRLSADQSGNGISKSHQTLPFSGNGDLEGGSLYQGSHSVLSHESVKGISVASGNHRPTTQKGPHLGFLIHQSFLAQMSMMFLRVHNRWSLESVKTRW
jgi:hypothetical protein